MKFCGRGSPWPQQEVIIDFTGDLCGFFTIKSTGRVLPVSLIPGRGGREGAGHHPNPFQVAPEASRVGCEGRVLAIALLT